VTVVVVTVVVVTVLVVVTVVVVYNTLMCRAFQLHVLHSTNQHYRRHGNVLTLAGVVPPEGLVLLVPASGGAKLGTEKGTNNMGVLREMAVVLGVVVGGTAVSPHPPSSSLPPRHRHCSCCCGVCGC